MWNGANSGSEDEDFFFLRLVLVGMLQPFHNTRTRTHTQLYVSATVVKMTLALSRPCDSKQDNEVFLNQI
eukprot:m.28647 g.28647  ORF g.28647 m.28647 type:complete len:70 (+) comp9058_c0_seq3:272-481(+)